VTEPCDDKHEHNVTEHSKKHSNR